LKSSADVWTALFAVWLYVIALMWPVTASQTYPDVVAADHQRHGEAGNERHLMTEIWRKTVTANAFVWRSICFASMIVMNGYNRTQNTSTNWKNATADDGHDTNMKMNDTNC